jgi:hypothetical protein
MEKDELKAQIKSLANEVIILKNHLRAIIDERDTWRDLYLEEKHRYDEHVHGKQVQE